MWDLISWQGIEPKPPPCIGSGVVATGHPRKLPYIFLYAVPAVTGNRHVKDKIYYLLWRSCAFLCAESLQSCQTLFHPMDCSPPDSSVPGILQARILEWVAMFSSRGSSQPRDQTRVSDVSCIGKGVLNHLCHLWSPMKTVLTHNERLKICAFCRCSIHTSDLAAQPSQNGPLDDHPNTICRTSRAFAPKVGVRVGKRAC